MDSENAIKLVIDDLVLDAQEVMDHVDEMLAWQAIASESAVVYEHSHYYRAVPMIDVGGHNLAMLTTQAARCLEDQPEDDRKADNARYEAWSRAALPDLLTRYKGVRYARIMESRGTTIFGNALSGEMSTSGDDVRDALEDGGFKGARYSMESIGECSDQVRRRLGKELRFPQVARLFMHNAIVALADGRATSATRWVGYWNRTLFDVNRKPMRPTGDGTNPTLVALMHGIVEVRNRETWWDVELALGAKRTGIALKTDAIGARAVVNLLRKTETRSGRRKSLVHWVDEHMRRRRADDEEATIQVKAHLRGLAGLDAGRYFARIWPAAGALDRASNGDRYRGVSQGATE
jgi:hypothetical protein